MERPRILMCRPDHYGIYYSINPWMKKILRNEGNQKIRREALGQWHNLKSVYEEEGFAVQPISQVSGCPDMVFVANAGLVCGNIFVSSNFRYAERQPEESHFRKCFQGQGFQVKTVEGKFEGHGDALFHKGTLVCMIGFRSSDRGVRQAAEHVGKTPVVLKLVDERFYHGDTCFCPLDPILFYPRAFDRPSRRKIERLGEAEALGEKDALAFVGNGTPLYRGTRQIYVGPMPSKNLRKKLENRGISIREVSLPAFKKSGGGARCLTL